MSDMTNETPVRTRNRPKKTPPAPTTPAARELRRQQAVALRAQGHGQAEIAAALRVAQTTVSSDLKRPKSQHELTTLRAIAREKLLTSTSHTIIDKASALVEKTLDDQDAKSFDFASRGLLNLEKVSASASGEARRVDVTGDVTSRVDVRALLVKYAAAQEG